MEKKKKISLRVIIQMLVYLVFFPMLPLLLSGRWDWWEAWFYALSCFFSFAISRIIVARKFPDLLAERGKFLEHENAQPWDRILAPLVGLGGNVVPLTVGLEARYGQVFDFGLPLELIAILLYLFGFAWGSYALITNRYFSGMVRMQTDRGHQVVTGGPYRFMRHPGYAGALLTYSCHSLFSWIRSGLFCRLCSFLIVVVVRTRLEDNFLQAELPGYKEYAQEGTLSPDPRYLVDLCRSEQVGRFLSEFTAWASARPDIKALALVGSQANGTARPDSDVDLVIITDRPLRYLEISIPERALSLSKGVDCEASHRERLVPKPDKGLDPELVEGSISSWISEFGLVENWQIEDYGKVRSLRVWYQHGLEVEYGFTDKSWVALPLDEGTRQVVTDGMRILFEREKILTRILKN